MEMPAPKPLKDSQIMKSIYYLDTRPAFQTLMGRLKSHFIELCAEHPEAAKDISINVGRICAAAIKAAEDASSQSLVDLIDYEIIPGPTFKDKLEKGDSSYKNAAFKTVHLPLLMTDYLKAGGAQLNLQILGPREDEARRNAGHNGVTYRITSRQYLHLALIHLSTLPKEYQLISLISSHVLYPFAMPGPAKRKTPKIVVNNDKKSKKS